MRVILFVAIAMATPSLTYAQTIWGQGIEYRYNGAGFRELRYYDPNTIIKQKPGGSSEQQADTVIGLQQYKDNVEKEFVRAYPNPVIDNLFIENLYWKDGSQASVKVLDVTGKLLLSKPLLSAKEQIDLRNLIPGSYNVNYFINNEYVISWKIVKIK